MVLNLPVRTPLHLLSWHDRSDDRATTHYIETVFPAFLAAELVTRCGCHLSETMTPELCIQYYELELTLQAGVVTGKNLRALMADAKQNKVSTVRSACRGRRSWEPPNSLVSGDLLVEIERSRPDSPLRKHSRCGPLRSHCDQTPSRTRSPLGSPPSPELDGVGSG